MLITFVLFIIHSQKRDPIWKRSVRGLTLLYVDVLWNLSYFNFFFFFSLYIYIFFLFFMFLFVVVLGGSLVLSLSNLYSSLFSSSLSTFIFPSDLGSNLIILCRKLTAFSSSFLSLLFISDFLKIFTIYTNNSQYITISIRMKLKLKLQKLQTIN